MEVKEDMEVKAKSLILGRDISPMGLIGLMRLIGLIRPIWLIPNLQQGTWL